MILGRLACKVYGFIQKNTEVLGVACKSLLSAKATLSKNRLVFAH